jgi:carbonic anhydrase/acetyltransferase-like protein (isoleucine patch superfamily)
MSEVVGRLDEFLRRQPRIDRAAYLAAGASVVGDVRMGPHSSVWYQCTIRADINYIEIGDHSNVQDNAVVHVSDDFPSVIGCWVTVGHSAIIHACTIGDRTLIGMGATVLDGAVVGDECLVGANSLVTAGTKIPDGSLVLGSPAKVVRQLSAQERRDLKPWAEKYVDNAAYCLKHGLNIGKPLVTA